MELWSPAVLSSVIEVVTDAWTKLGVIGQAIIGLPLVGVGLRGIYSVIRAAVRWWRARPTLRLETSEGTWRLDPITQVSGKVAYYLHLRVPASVQYRGSESDCEAEALMWCSGRRAKEWLTREAIDTSVAGDASRLFPEHLRSNGRWKGVAYLRSDVLKWKSEEPRFELVVTTVSGARVRRKIRAHEERRSVTPSPPSPDN